MIDKILHSLPITPAYAAASTPTSMDNLLRSGDRTVASSGDIFTLVQSIMDRIPVILGGMAFLALVYSGVLYISAFGDTTKMESAKKNITWVFTGILAVAVVLIVMNIVIRITGSRMLNGTNPLV